MFLNGREKNYSNIVKKINSISEKYDFWNGNVRSSFSIQQMKKKFIQENLVNLGKNKNSESLWHVNPESLPPHISLALYKAMANMVKKWGFLFPSFHSRIRKHNHLFPYPSSNGLLSLNSEHVQLTGGLPVVKKPPANAGEAGSTPRSERSSGDHSSILAWRIPGTGQGLPWTSQPLRRRQRF